MAELKGKDRLIVALDVPTHDEALHLVDALKNVNVFKIGLELFLAGDLFGFLRKLQERRRPGGGVFVDLKLGGDIGNTISSFVQQSRRLGIRFITLIQTDPIAITKHTIQALRAARGREEMPQALMVPFFSSMGIEDLRAMGIQESVDSYIVSRGRVLHAAGCDGLIVSGTAIEACRKQFGTAMTLVSPGIRPAWAEPDDHARLTTPAEAIAMGSDYLVVGRPIRSAQNPHDAAQRIIDEIDEALDRTVARARSIKSATRPGSTSQVGLAP